MAEGTATVDGVSYATLQEAIDAASAGSVIKLNEDVSTTIKVAEGQNVVIDLNGHVFTATGAAAIRVEGELTIQDSGDGKLLSTGVTNASNSMAIVTGTLTINGGTIETPDSFGVYCKDSGKVVMNGGTFTGKYPPLSGNNTTGDMNFEINGGILKSLTGPAIYMPGQVSLIVTDGIIDGGISLRMGQVNISGGDIRATTGSISDMTKYYNYSGCVLVPDALCVMGGTYSSSNETYGNSLNMNITGGTFSCANGQGSAVAIYDLGKIAQDMTVNIASANLATNTTTRTAYQVVTLADIGVTEPATGYGNEEYTGKVKTTIHSGTFTSAIPDDQLADGTKCVDNGDGTYSVVAA